MQAARLPVLVTLLQVVEDPAGLDGAAPLAGDQEGQLLGAVEVAVEQAGGRDQDGVVEERRFPCPDN